MAQGLQRAAAAAKHTQYPNTPAAAAGQLWKDNDTRSTIVRTVYIVETTKDAKPRARCEVYIDGVKSARETQIRCARFIPISTGYTYLGEGRDASASPAVS